MCNRGWIRCRDNAIWRKRRLPLQLKLRSVDSRPGHSVMLPRKCFFAKHVRKHVVHGDTVVLAECFKTIKKLEIYQRHSGLVLNNQKRSQMITF